ncbi:MAG: TetR/AcrR family transcriptional regulator [Thermoplasmata archaeon]|nr:TetR/AcrR family transcriptional regulator [Thermoplasmata archaeon]
MPLPKRRTEKSAETRRRILDASIELFIKNGYEKTTTRQIIQKAGILNGSLYNLFEGKDQIFSDVMMEALWDSIEESEKYMPKNIPFVDVVSFPICLLVYASSRSQRVAELFATSNRIWEINKRVCESMIDWITEKDVNHTLPTETEDFRIRIYACMGAVGNIIERFEKEPGCMSDRDAINVLAEILVNAFGLSTMNLKERVDSVYTIVSTHDLVICGMHVVPQSDGIGIEPVGGA